MEIYYHRLVEERLKGLFASFPVVVVTGARQVGKSTLLEKLFPKIPRVVFDPSIDVENARADPDLFLNNRRPPLILDEIQFVPELVPALKRHLDRDKKRSQFLITGSQQWEVMKHLSESLAGRAVFIDLAGFSLQEVANITAGAGWVESWLKNPSIENAGRLRPLSGPVPVYAQIWRGFLPEAQFLASENIPPFLSAYQRTYIERDVRQLSGVEDLQTFGRFFKLCSALTAQEVNHSELGRDIGVTPQTAGRWLAVLTSTFQWLEIPPYFGSTIKRISRKPKGYLTDTGLVCSAQAISAPEVIGGHPMWGALFETAVVMEVIKQSRALKSPPNFYHWRSHGGAEVDLILEKDGEFYPIEIKGSTRPGKRDLMGIEAFRQTYPRLKIPTGLIVAPVDSSFPLDSKTVVIPWNGFLS